MRRAWAALGAAALVAGLALPARAAVERQLVAEATGIGFAVRLTADQGGAAALPLYLGYAESNLAGSDSDGQGSWYNLGLIETAAFRRAEDCTPERNLEATAQGVQDVADWATAYVASVGDAVADGDQPSPPTVPGPRHACTERFPGFAQARFPDTTEIGTHDADNYLDGPGEAAACREDPDSQQCGFWRTTGSEALDRVRDFARDGVFTATAGATAHRSEAQMGWVGAGGLVTAAAVETTTDVRLDPAGPVLRVASTTVMTDVCIVPEDGACGVRIASLKQVAAIEQRLGKGAETTERFVVSGITSAALSREVTARDLLLNNVHVAVPPYGVLSATSKTGACGAAEDGVVVADSGGLVMSGRGDPFTIPGQEVAGQRIPDTTIPGGGGGIVIGGACARARLVLEEFEVPEPDPGDPGAPPQTIVIPGLGPVPVVGPAKPLYGPPRVITRPTTRYFLREALVWRMLPYWASVLGALALLAGLGYMFRAKPVVAPAARALDRFARQFLRG